MELRDKRPDILRIAASHAASNIRVFGSAARGEDRPDNDLDLLVDMEAGRSLLDLVGLAQDLKDLLQAKGDVLQTRAFIPPCGLEYSPTSDPSDRCEGRSPLLLSKCEDRYERP